jgi:hypothetical protein
MRRASAARDDVAECAGAFLMCACEPGFVCARCRLTPFDDDYDRQPLTLAQFDLLIADNDTAEPFEGRPT